MNGNPRTNEWASPVSVSSCRSALVVEDLPDVRSWLAQALRTAFQGIEVGEAGSLAEARAWLDALASDPERKESLKLVLIDLGLPDGSGIDLVRELAQKHPEAQSIVATIYDDDAHLFPAIAAGAQGYLLKDQDVEALARQLRQIDEGIPPLSPSISRRMLAHFRELAARAAEGIDAEGVDAFDKIAERERAQRDAQAGVGNGGSPRGAAGPEGLPGGAPSLAALIPEIALSPRETEVLSYIGRGLRVTEAARVLGLTDHTVAGYVKSLYRKLNISSRAEAALEAARRGLV